METQGQIHGTLLDFYVAAAVFVGFVECFFGYRIFRFILGVAGFMVAAVFAGSLGYELSGGSELAAIAAAIAGGLAGAFLAYYLYIIGVFVLGAALGYMIAVYVFGLLDKEPVTILLIIAAILCGVVAAVFQKPMIILATAFGGACAVVTGVFYFLERNFHPLDPGFLGKLGEDQLYWMAMIWFALGVFGLVVQLMTLPRRAAPAPPAVKHAPEAAPPPPAEGNQAVGEETAKKDENPA